MIPDRLPPRGVCIQYFEERLPDIMGESLETISKLASYLLTESEPDRRKALERLYVLAIPLMFPQPHDQAILSTHWIYPERPVGFVAKLKQLRVPMNHAFQKTPAAIELDLLSLFGSYGKQHANRLLDSILNQ